MTKDLPDGVYFDLPESIYRDLRRLGSTDLPKLLRSVGQFWSTSWLNPQREPKQTDAQSMGSAWHCARLESDHFPDRYYRMRSPRDLDSDALLTLRDMKDAARDLEIVIQRKGETAIGLCMRLQEAGCELPMLPAIREVEEAEAGDRIGIPGEKYDEIIAAMERWQGDPDLEPLFNARGAAEVSVLWHDPLTDAPCKARYDRIHPGGWVDVKTYEPRLRGIREELRQCKDRFRFDAGYLQATHYRAGLEEMSARGDLGLTAETSDEHQKLWRALMTTIMGGAITCHYVYFDRTSPDVFSLPIDWRVPNPAEPNALIPSLLWQRGQHDRRRALRMYRDADEIFGPGEPWREIVSDKITDEDFSPHWLEERL